MTVPFLPCSGAFDSTPPNTETVKTVPVPVPGPSGITYAAWGPGARTVKAVPFPVDPSLILDGGEDFSNAVSEGKRRGSAIKRRREFPAEPVKAVPSPESEPVSADLLAWRNLGRRGG